MRAEDADQLFEQTLTTLYDDETAWQAVEKLQADGDQHIFEKAAGWCRHNLPLQRARGATVLGQLRKKLEDGADWSTYKLLFSDQSFTVISTMLTQEQESMVLDAAICALGHIGNPAAASLLLKYIHHRDAAVRFAVAFCLGCFPDAPESVTGLLHLTKDIDNNVRDWAVFGLGVQGNQDSNVIRAALLRCLADKDVDVREEAAVGLAKRHDLRVLPTLKDWLSAAHPGCRPKETALLMLELEGTDREFEMEELAAALAAKFYGKTISL